MSVEYKIRGDASQLKKELQSVTAKEQRLTQQTIRTKQGFDKLNTAALRNENALRRAKLATQKVTAAELKFAASTKVATAGLVNQRRVTTGLAARIGALRNQLLLFSFATVAVVGGIKKILGESSALEESQNAINVIFKEGVDVIREFGKTSRASVALSTREFNQLATVSGALIKELGLPMQQVASLTVDLTKRAADMASVFDTEVSVALNAINSALRGQTEPLTQFGVDTTDAALGAFLLSKGINRTTASLTRQEKSWFKIELIMSKTKDTEGDFKATQDSLANSTKTLTARLTDLAAAFGKEIEPTAKNVVNVLDGLLGIVDKLQERSKDRGVTFGLISDEDVERWKKSQGLLKDINEEAKKLTELKPGDLGFIGPLNETFKEMLERTKLEGDELFKVKFLLSEQVETLKARNKKLFEGNGISETEITLKVQALGMTMEEFELETKLLGLMSNKKDLEAAVNTIITRRLTLVKEVTEFEKEGHKRRLDAIDAQEALKNETRGAARAAASFAASLADAVIFSRDLKSIFRSLIGTAVSIGFNKAFGVPGFAHGTNFAPGGAAIVGERGPELINLPRGSQVTPNQTTNNTNNNVSFNMPNVKTFDRFTVENQLMPLIREQLAEGDFF